MSVVRVSYRVPGDREEAAVAALWEAGTLGIQVLEGEAGTLRLEAYFEGPGPGHVSGLAPMGRAEVPAQDWLAPYREAAVPFPVGDRLLLDPRDPDAGPPVAEPGRTTLRIPARAAFGTGSHETTRLALELLEPLELEGRSVLDVGTGTGILAFAALLAGAWPVVGLDVDPAAPFHARDNARLNSLHPLLLAGGPGALRPPVRGGGTGFDAALVNVVPEEIEADLPAVVGLLRSGGEAIFSGILAASGARVLRDLAELGLAPVAERTLSEWVAFRVRRTA
ncbi:MAG: 50S ribosomal protein L11 methyltransferase [Thermoanaerobaculia bacterium]